ncbi:MAG: DUF3795 domain-containing protein [Actinomycetota bacterium]
MEGNNNLIACCGLDCSTCGAYIATKANDDSKRAEVAGQWSAMYNAEIKPEDINCNGCLSKEQKFSHCNVCEIRKCCMEKELENCAGCEMYACDKLEDFFKMVPDCRTALDKLRT